MSLVGWGVDVMPNNESWLPSAIIWIIAFAWFILTLVYIIRHRKDKSATKNLNIHEIKEKEAEILSRIESRKEYLPALKSALNSYISRVEYLANNSTESLDLERYKDIYFKGKKFGISEKASLLVELYKFIPIGENLVFREVLEKDTELQNLRTTIDGLGTFAKDKRIRMNIKGYPEASYKAYSYIIYNRLQKEHYDDTSMVYKFRYRTIEKMTNRLRDLQNETNKRIDELLEGAEDEL